MKLQTDEIRFDERGLVPAVVQDSSTREVLTLAYMNIESLERTIETKETWFWSRSRSSLWHKGETSGHTQRVTDILVDCDRDSLTVLVSPKGPACHTGERSCFHQRLQDTEDSSEKPEQETELGPVLDDLYGLVVLRKQNRPKDSYTSYLFDQGLDKILKKVGEEASETIIAAKNDAQNNDRDALVRETADLFYHLIVLMVERGLTLEQIGAELVSRGKRREAR